MNIKRVCAVCFSPTGNTKRLVQTIAAELAGRLCCSLMQLDFTPPGARKAVTEFGEGDLVVVGSPTYAGKLPNKILPDFQTKLKGNGAAAVAVVTFGNRSYDNSLTELLETLRANGFHPAAGAAFACRHAFTDSLAPGRPDGDDFQAAAQFAQHAADSIRQLAGLPDPPVVPGRADAPYYIPKGLDGQPAQFLKAKPLTLEEACTHCGLCARLCPLGSIDPADVTRVPGVCIKCHACVRGCPEGAKYFDDPAFLSHAAMLNENYREPKDNEFYLSPSF